MAERSRRYRRNKTKFKPNMRFYIFCFCILAVVALCVFILKGIKHKVNAETGSMSFSYSTKGIIIRNETLYQTENYSKSVFIASEGQKVNNGTVIADIYTYDYNDSVVSQLKTVQDKIMEYQQNTLLGGTVSEEMASLNGKIAQKSEQISRLLCGTADGDIPVLEKELRELLKERTNLLYESVQGDATLTDYITQETDLKAQIDGWKKTITASESGLVSFYFDGCETILTPDNMTKLGLAQLENILEGKNSYTISDTNASRPFYRLVDENEWYIVMIADEYIPEFENKNVFYITINGDKGKQYSATVQGYNKANDSYIYYLSLEDSIKDLLLARTVDIELSYEYKGIKVKKSAISTEKNIKGIYLRENNKKKFIPVNTLIERDGVVIIETIDPAIKIDNSCVIYE